MAASKRSQLLQLKVGESVIWEVPNIDRAQRTAQSYSRATGHRYKTKGFYGVNPPTCEVAKFVRITRSE